MKNIDIPDSVTNITTLAFYRCNGLVSVQVPGSVTAIKNGTFRECNNLKKVILNEGVAKIEDSAFVFCSSLEQIKLPQSLMSIGSGAFDNCTSLISVELPDNAIISSSTFRGCKNLSKIVLSDTNNNYIVKNGILYNKNITRILCYPAGIKDTEFFVPDTVKTIGDFAFYGTKALESINIPDSVTNIGTDAFGECSGLKEVWERLYFINVLHWKK